MVFKSVSFVFLSGILIIGVNAQISGRPFRDLTLELRPMKARLVPLEPISLRLVLANRTDSSIRTHGNLSFATGYVKLSVEVPSSSVFDLGQLSHVIARSVPVEKDMPPGASHEIVQVLSFDLERHFNQIGRYRIKASFKSLDGNQTITSDWSRFEIVQPIGTNIAAYDFLRQKKDLSTFFCCYDEGSVEDARAFINVFPDSAYSDYARFPLASYYILKRDPERAREQLDKLRGKENFGYSEDVKRLSKKLEPQPRN